MAGHRTTIAKVVGMSNNDKTNKLLWHVGMGKLGKCDGLGIGCL